MTESTIEMCAFYTTMGYPTFKPVCKLGHRAGLRCHVKCSCPGYQPSVAKKEA